MRTNFRFIDRAMDWPSEVLPTPGGPTKQRIGPFIRTLGTDSRGGVRAVTAAAVTSAGDTGDVDGTSGGGGGVSACDALFRSFWTARYSTIRSLTLSRS